MKWQKKFVVNNPKSVFFWRLKRPKLARIVSWRLETSLALMMYLAVSVGERVAFISLLHNILVKKFTFWSQILLDSDEFIGPTCPH